MGEKLPVVSGKEFIRYLEKHGFKRKRKDGSHIVLSKPGIARPVVVPDHDELKVGVLLNNLKTAKISRDEFIRAMRAH